MRCNNYVQDMPTIRTKINAKDEFLVKFWKIAQNFTSENKIKVTLPGPMTIINTCAIDSPGLYDNNHELLTMDLAEALNVEVLRLVEAGVEIFQIDEPLWARQPDEAHRYGFKAMEKAFENVGADIFKCVHICCGYTNLVNQDDYKKADNHVYVQLAEKIDDLKCIDAVSIEDAHTRIPLEFFNRMKKTKVILGCLKVCRTDQWEMEEICDRVREILRKTTFKKEDLILAPDCGFAMMKRDYVLMSLKRMVEASKILRKEFM